MNSLKELYRIGFGPSSSHTIGPFRAGRVMIQRCPDAYRYRVTLLGSLALTGVGHFTDKSLERAFEGYNLEIVFDKESPSPQHPNGLILEALDKDDNVLDTWHTYSIGGGTLIDQGSSLDDFPHVYPHKYMSEIMQYCKDEKIELWEYVDRFDNDDIWEYLEEILNAMMDAIDHGLTNEEEFLPPKHMKFRRRAKSVYENTLNLKTNPVVQEQGLVSAYALAVSEENASMGVVVTAPTCGACGVVPAVLRYAKESRNLDKEQLKKALAVAGIIGLLAKHNASVSGAEAGCQAEVGVACCMAAAAYTYLLGLSIDHIEYAAEIAMEHHLGMTCDPIGGFVLIPCIERNATAAVRALQCAYFVELRGSEHTITYDEVLKTMIETGRDMNSDYRETSQGGLAKYFEKFVKEEE
ncbi:MAG: L-serine ammonia-lyase, iron-sulfur-dependent, subunit alpha [Brevinema sp.]